MLSLNQKKVFKCKICTQNCAYHFYGVKACEGCKQFFRRVVIKQQKYFCSKEQKCKITGGDNCRGCRLTKCLLMGMNPFMVQLKIKPEERAKKLQFIEELKQMQNALWLRRKHEMRFGDPMVQIWQMINSLTPVERMHKQIWESTKLFPTAYTETHDSVEGLLQDDNGLMGMVEYFKSDNCWDKAHFMEELETKSFLHSDYLKLITKDWFLCVETAKGMPFFKKLDISDQVSLLKGSINEVCTLSASFYSNARGSDTITRANGFAPICQLEGKNFPKNQHIRSIYFRANCEGIERIKQTGICNEEFVLLLVILFANSNVDNLSTRGRELLYAESVRYSKALHQLLQAKYGTFPGTQKFMEAMSLLEVASKMKTLLAAFVINLEMIYERPNKSQTFPKAIEFYPKTLVR